MYNTLQLFMSNGLVIPILINEKEMRYDGNTQNHHHFYCMKCNKIYDLDFRCEYFERGEVQGYRIKEFHGYFKGICRECNI